MNQNCPKCGSDNAAKLTWGTIPIIICGSCKEATSLYSQKNQ